MSAYPYSVIVDEEGRMPCTTSKNWHCAYPWTQLAEVSYASLQDTSFLGKRCELSEAKASFEQGGVINHIRVCYQQKEIKINRAPLRILTSFPCLLSRRPSSVLVRT